MHWVPLIELLFCKFFPFDPFLWTEWSPRQKALCTSCSLTRLVLCPGSNECFRSVCFIPLSTDLKYTCNFYLYTYIYIVHIWYEYSFGLRWHKLWMPWVIDSAQWPQLTLSGAWFSQTHLAVLFCLSSMGHLHEVLLSWTSICLLLMFGIFLCETVLMTVGLNNLQIHCMCIELVFVLYQIKRETIMYWY